MANDRINDLEVVTIKNIQHIQNSAFLHYGDNITSNHYYGVPPSQQVPTQAAIVGVAPTPLAS
jgi:hypothetical protein